ncbi:MAG: hypothetical protein KDE31_35310, partial [Caldilineaceae bacterium]|nr:hypothetical protein [Caldilineaceae bacterium]
MFLTILYGFVLNPTTLYAAPPTPTDNTPTELLSTEAAIQQLQTDSTSTITISRHPSLGTVRLIQFQQTDEPGDATTQAAQEVSSAALASTAERFFADYGAIFGLDPTVTDLMLDAEQADSHGYRRLAYQEQYQGVPIFGAKLYSHFNQQGQLTAINGVSGAAPQLTAAKLNTTPTLSAEAALAVATAHVAMQLQQDGFATAATSTTLQGTTATLVIYDTGLVKGTSGWLHLVYRIEVADPQHHVREFVFVDAHSGIVVEQFTGVHPLEREVSEGSLGNVIWDEGQGHPDPIPSGWSGGNAARVAAWNDEITGAKEAYNSFGSITNGGRLSYDGAEAVMRTVNNDPNIKCPNAVWDGTSANYCNGVTADDIVVHEWGHAYTEYTNGLVYIWQPGALNESFSDIWGETADLINNGRGTDVHTLRTTGACSTYSGFAGGDNSTRWLAGEEIGR